MWRHTKEIRAFLPLAITALQIKTILDLPCGDCNWISGTNLADAKYLGCDVDPENIELAKRRGMRVMLCDAFAGPPPAADLLLCRDFLQHLPDAKIDEFLALHVKSGRYKYVAFTSHDVDRFDSLREAGQYRPINLCREPFGWPEPIMMCHDGEGRILGIWQ